MSQIILMGTKASRRPASNLLDAPVWFSGVVDDLPLQIADETRLKMRR